MHNKLWKLTVLFSMCQHEGCESFFEKRRDFKNTCCQWYKFGGFCVVSGVLMSFIPFRVADFDMWVSQVANVTLVTKSFVWRLRICGRIFCILEFLLGNWIYFLLGRKQVHKTLDSTKISLQMLEILYQWTVLLQIFILFARHQSRLE